MHACMREARLSEGRASGARPKGIALARMQAFYSKVVIFASRKAVGGFARSYGIGILTCTVGLMAVKRTLRAVPVVGLTLPR